MEDLVSPRQAALAIGVSESSLKRWCDRGLVPTTRTPGGHRRVPISAVADYLRRHPGAPGTPSAAGLEPVVAVRSPSDCARKLTEALVEGDESGVRSLLLGLYLGGQDLVQIGDGVVAPAMREIGERWQHRDLEIFRERRASTILDRTLGSLRRLLPPPPPDAPRAIGASFEGDHYSTAAMLFELVLRSIGWSAEWIGASQPVATLASAIAQMDARMAWISISHVADREQLAQDAQSLFQAASDSQCAVLFGGRALDQRTRKLLTLTPCCSSLAEGAAIARALEPGAQR